MKLENVTDIYPLSPIQQGMLFHILAAPKSGIYIGQYTFKLRGKLQPKVLQTAWQHVLNRHPALRTIFLWQGLNEPLQVVRQEVELSWDTQDWQALSPKQQAQSSQKLLLSERHQGFKLDQAPLMRMTLIRLGEESYQLIWNCHHLIADGWSTTLIWEDVCTAYSNLVKTGAAGFSTAPSYRGYVAWLQQQNLSKSQEFWQENLKGFTEPTSLPLEQFGGETTELGNASRTEEYQQHSLYLSSSLTKKLQDFARQHHLTLNILILAAWTLLLKRYSTDEDVVYGVTLAGRPVLLKDALNTVGPFLNTLPMRVQVREQTDCLSWLKSLQQQFLQLQEYECTSLLNIQKWSELPRGQNLFESMVVLENVPSPHSQKDLGFILEQMNFQTQNNYPLVLLVTPGQTLELCLGFETSRFRLTAIAQLLRHLEQILHNLITHTHNKLEEISLLSEREFQQILVEWNKTESPYPDSACMHQLIETQVKAKPEAIAVTEINPNGFKSLTYQELDQQATQLAHYLLAQGMSVNAPIGIYLDRSIAMIIAILAVLKAGGAYVPLDPTYPSDRITYYVEQSGVELLITKSDVLEKEPLADAVSKITCLLNLEIETSTIAQQPITPLEHNINNENLAYIIFTSGSTGKPKGVRVTHQNLVHSTTARSSYYSNTVESYLLLSSFAFDSSVAGIFWTLSQGGNLVLPPVRIEQNLSQLARIISQQKVSHTLCLPSLYALLLEERLTEQLQSLQTVIVAGEACPRALAKQHYQQLPKTKLYNEYGPTEATVWSSVYQMNTHDDTGVIPIGKPIANTQLYLLDDQLRPVPLGAVGEIYIGGAGITKGYLNQPQQTQERFITNPFSLKGSEYLYRTGDLARYREDGNIEWLGRRDRQVKIRGHRIELGEIEEALRRHSEIREVVVVADDSLGKSNSSEEVDWLVEQLLTLERSQAENLLKIVCNS